MHPSGAWTFRDAPTFFAQPLFRFASIKLAVIRKAIAKRAAHFAVRTATAVTEKPFFHHYLSFFLLLYSPVRSFKQIQRNALAYVCVHSH